MVLGFVSFLCHNGWESNLFLVMSRNSVIEVFMLCTFFNLYIHTNVHCANKVLYQKKKKKKRLNCMNIDMVSWCYLITVLTIGNPDVI